VSVLRVVVLVRGIVLPTLHVVIIEEVFMFMTSFLLFSLSHFRSSLLTESTEHRRLDWAQNEIHVLAAVYKHALRLQAGHLFSMRALAWETEQEKYLLSSMNPLVHCTRRAASQGNKTKVFAGGGRSHSRGPCRQHTHSCFH